MNKRSISLKKVLYIGVTLIIVALVVFRLKNNKDITSKAVYHYDKEQAITVHADTLKLERIGVDYSLSGIFEPNKETKLSAETQGKINSVFVDVGSHVRKGQALIQLDNELLKLQLQAINVQLEGLDADIKRYTILVDADAIQGVQLEKVVLGKKSARVQKSLLAEQIQKTTIRAPFDGIVTAKLSEVGSFAAPGVPLLQLTDISELRFTVNVPENDLSQFTWGQRYPISADSYPNILMSGKISLIGSKANMGNSFPVQFLVNNTQKLEIKSGMFGKVNYKNSQEQTGIIIPSSAIIGSTEKPQVYLIKNGKAVLQTISIARKIKNGSVVGSGLNVGDVLITSGFINLFENANVKAK